MRKESSIAIKNLKKSVSVGEFESILNLARKIYSKLEEGIQKREDFIKSTKENRDKEGILDGLSEANASAAMRLFENLEKRADKAMFQPYKSDIKDHKNIVEFINRFSSEENQLKLLDFSFLD
jgi:hypothetical protein